MQNYKLFVFVKGCTEVLDLFMRGQVAESCGLINIDFHKIFMLRSEIMAPGLDNPDLEKTFFLLRTLKFWDYKFCGKNA